MSFIPGVAETTNAAEGEKTAQESGVAPARSHGSETILVVEDDQDVRAHANEILRQLAEKARRQRGLPRGAVTENHTSVLGP
jgi:hypothetical protein